MRNLTEVYGRPALMAVASIVSILILAMLDRSTFAVPQLDRPIFEDRPTQVRLGIFALDVDEVNTAEQSFKASIYFEARWNDPRLVEQGLTNVEVPLTEVWNPRLQVLNQQKVWETFPQTVEIKANGEVVYRQRVWGAFSQPLQLHNFPFDRQKLNILIVAAGYDPDEVEFVPLLRDKNRIFGIAKSFSLPDWEVERWTMQGGAYSAITGQDEIAAMTMTIDIRRYSVYFISKVIIPLSFIIMMSWVSLWINPKEIGINISAVMTAILTLVAYRFAIAGQLPQVAYNTRMDNFIIASTVIVFACLLQVVINSRLVIKGKIDVARRLDYWGRAVYPIAFIAILVWSLWL